MLVRVEAAGRLCKIGRSNRAALNPAHAVGVEVARADRADVDVAADLPCSSTSPEPTEPIWTGPCVPLIPRSPRADAADRWKRRGHRLIVASPEPTRQQRAAKPMSLGLEVARADRGREFVRGCRWRATSPGTGVARSRARAPVDAGVAGADLQLHQHAVRHAGLQLHVRVVAAEGDAAEIAVLALGGDHQSVRRLVLGQGELRRDPSRSDAQALPSTLLRGARRGAHVERRCRRCRTPRCSRRRGRAAGCAAARARSGGRSGRARRGGSSEQRARGSDFVHGGSSLRISRVRQRPQRAGRCRGLSIGLSPASSRRRRRLDRGDRSSPRRRPRRSRSPASARLASWLPGREVVEDAFDRCWLSTFASLKPSAMTRSMPGTMLSSRRPTHVAPEPASRRALNRSIRSNQLTKMPANSGTMIAHRNGLLRAHAEQNSSQPTVGSAHSA